MVRILADAGVDPRSHYRQDHVLGPLKQAIADFGENTLHLDLVIGTHYDADHLEGLIPIITDRNITVAEAWMPPVANDTEPHALEDEPQERNLLPKQFEQENGKAVLEHYFVAKQQVCGRLRILQHAAQEAAENRNSERNQPNRSRPTQEQPLEHRDWLELQRERFKRHLTEAEQAAEDRYESHADEDIQQPSELFPEGFASGYDTAGSERLPWWQARWLWLADEQQLRSYWSKRPDRATVDARGLAILRRSAAKDAINAVSLYKVVVALRKRNIPIVCRIINDGIPRRFVWQRATQCFIEGPQLVGAPQLTLLGPSRALVKKHWHRLPIGDYICSMLSFVLPSRSITPSNQLSCVLRLGFEEQGILVAGDAGCVDFAPNRRSKFYKALLDALLPLQVVQVAHHGGNNAQFYNVLLNAQYATQAQPSRLLLSHATNDAHRPSDLFERFVAAVRKNVDNIQILFTSKPRDAYVQSYKTLIASAVGTPKPAGDVRLAFDGRIWIVEKHAIQVV